MSGVEARTAVDDTNDPGRISWVEAANDPAGDFPIQNLPFGIFSTGGTSEPHVGVAIGDDVLDLTMLPADSLPAGVKRHHLAAPSLDALLALGRLALGTLRGSLSVMLSTDAQGNALRARRDEVLVPLSRCVLHRPTSVPDYTDFYAGIEHALRAGGIARPGSTLGLNYGTQPIGYHGRSSTVRVSGHPVPRPSGPRPAGEGRSIVMGPSEALDFELELGAILCGQPDSDATISGAAQRVAGLCLLNDWSARDIQRWEMAPLGPFLGKSFVTTLSPWLVTLEALAPFRIPAVARRPEHGPLLPYLDDALDQAQGGFDIALGIILRSQAMRAGGMPGETIATSNSRYLYWTMAQMAAHHAVNGCELRPGDLIGTGTISGPDMSESGSLLELTANGRDPIRLRSGELRTYLQDGDELSLYGRCSRSRFASIGFGPCVGTITSSEAAR